MEFQIISLNMYVSIPSIQQACVLNTCNNLCCTTLNNIKCLPDKVLLTLWSFASILNHLFNGILYFSYTEFNKFLFKAQTVLLRLASLAETLPLTKVTVNPVSNENDYAVR